MDLDEIRSMPKIYQKGSMYFSYAYHYDPKRPREIFLEYNIMCEAQYLYCYELKEDKGVFLLIGHQYGTGSEDCKCQVAGHTEREALEFMIKKIIEMPAGNAEENRVNIAVLETSLREALLQKVA